jgi:hypothetical protein
MAEVDAVEDKLDATLDLLWSMWTGPTSDSREGWVD